jgi:hypothetical protein
MTTDGENRMIRIESGFISIYREPARTKWTLRSYETRPGTRCGICQSGRITWKNPRVFDTAECARTFVEKLLISGRP